MLFQRVALIVFALSAVAFAGAQSARDQFFKHNRFTHTWGDNEPRYGKVDANIRVEVQALFLGTQVFEEQGGVNEFKLIKARNSYNINLPLARLNPLFPNEILPLVGTPLTNGTDVRWLGDRTYPGPYRLQGEVNGIAYDLTLRNVRAQVDITGRFRFVADFLNPVLNELVDVQYEDFDGGIGNKVSVVPGQVSGWIVSPIFQVTRIRVDVTNIQHAGQVAKFPALVGPQPTRRDP